MHEKQAYELGVLQAMVDAGLLKVAGEGTRKVTITPKALKIPWKPLAAGAGIGALGGAASDDSSAGIGALRGLSAGAGSIGGAALGQSAGRGLLPEKIRQGLKDAAKAPKENAFMNAKRVSELAHEIPHKSQLLLGRLKMLGALGGAVGGYQLMKHLGPQPQQSLRQRLGLE